MMGRLCVVALVGCGAATSAVPVTIPRDVPTSVAAPRALPVASSAAAPSSSGAWQSAAVEAVAGSPRDAIDRMLKLLREGAVEELFNTLVDPADLKKLTDSEPLSDVIAAFRKEGKDRDLVKLLVRVRDMTPNIDQAEHTATYDQEGEKTIRFHEIDGRWYVMND